MSYCSSLESYVILTTSFLAFPLQNSGRKESIMVTERYVVTRILLADACQ
jgi:hypothetical protein